MAEHDRVDGLDPVHALLEVLGAGPARVRLLERAGVAEPTEPLLQLRAELVVDGRASLVAASSPKSIWCSS